jgi:hypothetical protein
MLITIFLLLIFGACVGVLYTEGMWSNAIRLVNVVTAALLATSHFEAAARMLEGYFPSFTYVWDFLALWLLFALFMVVFRLLTDLISRVKVRFLSLADHIGSACFAVLVGWVMMCFAGMTLHTAPLARTFLGGYNPESPMFMGLLSPDRQWLAFAQRTSLGQFSCGMSADDRQKNRYGQRDEDKAWEKELRVFDRNSEFLPKYATRRARLQAHMAQPGTRSLRVDPSAK